MENIEKLRFWKVLFFIITCEIIRAVDWTKNLAHHFLCSQQDFKYTSKYIMDSKFIIITPYYLPVSSLINVSKHYTSFSQYV